MKNLSLVSLGSAALVAGILINAAPTKAADITLADGDSLVLDIKFRAFDTFGVDDGIINLVEFETDTVDDFAPDEQFGFTEVTNTTIAGISIGDTGGIQSFDFASPVDFNPDLPLDTSFDPFISNTFTAVPDFNPFAFIDVENDGINDLEINLTEVTATQNSPLGGTTSVFVSGSGIITTLVDQADTIVDFSGSLVLDTGSGNDEGDGGLTFIVSVPAQVPEPTTTAGLLAFGALGAAAGVVKRKKSHRA